MRDERLKRLLAETPVPDEDAARERSWRVVRAALDEREPVPSRPRRRARLVASLAAAVAVVLGLALTPAGAAVREWIDDIVSTGAGPAKPALTRVPGGGELLVESASGAWLVHEDGSRRRLGPYEQVSFSPNALHAIAARDRQLVAVDLDPPGEVRWSVTRPRAVRDPRWSPGDGFRIAYRSGHRLRVVHGDGVGDHPLVADAAPVPVAWAPPAAAPDARYALAYADRRGRIGAVDADSGERLWRSVPLGRIVSVAWPTRDRVVVAGEDRVHVLDRTGRVRFELPQPEGARVVAAAPSPDGRRIAIARTTTGPDAQPRSEVELVRLTPRRKRTIFSAQVTIGDLLFSPDGRWLLLGPRELDQWLFLRPEEDRKALDRFVPIGRISRQFAPGSRGPAPFPRVAGWCCE